MKWIPLLFSFTFYFDGVFCQDKHIKDPALSINFTLTDFTAAGNIKTAGIGEIFQFDKMQPKAGISLGYLNGIDSHFDYAVNANACFINYVVPGMPGTGKNNLLLDLTGSVNFKINTDKNLLSPYLTAGAGISKYQSYYGINIPAGLGVQLNYKNDVYVLLQSIYSFGITSHVNDYLRHSIGIAGNIKRRKTATVNPLPIAPALISKTIMSDKDQDGIIDSLDRCPDIPGLKWSNGCPDIDGDSIPDIDDMCPAVYGILKYKGCPVPDTDKDGSNDEIDSCINEPGPVSNHGCPEINSANQLELQKAAKNIFFETGSAILLTKSYASLDEIFEIVNTHKSYSIYVEGHTDNVGTNESNLLLSERRSQAVREYLVKKGITGGRIMFKGFGEDKPITDNATKEGRAKNRRVEIVLKNKF
jgi:OmpA-OmpF porin, OOP family